MQQGVAPRLGQPVLVENRPGAGGNLGTEAVVRSAPDGHTLLICGPVNTINGALYERLPFDFARDIVPVAGVVRVPLVMVVHPSVPATTVPEFIAHAKLGFARAVTRSDRQCASWRPAGDEQETVDQAGRDILRGPASR